MKNKIFFFSEEIKFKLTSETDTKNWIVAILKKYNQKIDFINFIFCNDEYLYQINKERLNHDTYTDIITFQYNEKTEALESDIYISIDRIKENSETYKVSFENELKRVLAHGVLHLFGFKDKTTKEQKEMTDNENICLEIKSVPRGTLKKQ